MKSKACGAYGTNCYLINTDDGYVVIDPGEGAFNFVVQNCKKVAAVLNTHGHHDHVWSNAQIKKQYDCKIYIHEKDAFLLKDPFNMGFEPHECDVACKDGDSFSFGGINFSFLHFPGHTPGCCMIEAGEKMFSGDFLFEGSIGRWDFPYSDAKEMINSLQKALKIKKDFNLYPGHGGPSTFLREKALLPRWIEYVKHG